MATEQILITVKTHPQPSSTNDETVCTAGINLRTNQFVRLYPIRFRFLEKPDQYKKWDVVEADLRPVANSVDRRGDTYTPNPDTFRVIDHLDAGSAAKWAKRNACVFPHVSSVEALNQRAAAGQGSLGIVKVMPGARMVARATSAEWDDKQAEIVKRQPLFGTKPAELKKPPWTFHYHFRCCEDCTTEHDMEVFDWEPQAAYFREAVKNGKAPEVARDAVLAIYNERYCPQERNVHLFLGTTISRQKQFSVIGVHYPPHGS